MQRLGIIDWGIGGISIYKLIKEGAGNVPIIYFSDTGVTPYGKMTRNELVLRLNTVIGFLKSKGVRHLVIGCNAASTAIDFVDSTDIKIEGVIESAVSATIMLKPARLGLIGGRRTVLSGVYRKAFAENGIKVEQRIAQPLSALIESGDVSSAELRNECKRILAPLKNCSHILLACTHYPAIIPVMRHCVSKETQFVDPSSALVKKIKPEHGEGNDIFLASGDPATMRSAALAAFGIKIGNVKHIEIRRH